MREDLEADALSVLERLGPEVGVPAAEVDRLKVALERVRSRARRELERNHPAVSVGGRQAGRVHALLRAQDLEALELECVILRTDAARGCPFASKILKRSSAIRCPAEVGAHEHMHRRVRLERLRFRLALDKVLDACILFLVLSPEENSNS